MQELAKFTTFLVLVLVLVVASPSFASSRRVKRSNWDSFLLAHTLDPSNPLESNYYYWNTRDWNNWLKLREPLHYLANYYQGKSLTQKQLHIVVIASEKEVERAFREPNSYGHGYGYEESYKWTNRRFQTYVFTRTFGYLSVYDCGRLYFAAKVRNNRPVHFESAYLTPFYNQYVGDISYNLSRHCIRVPY